jgi:hypothetical protein
LRTGKHKIFLAYEWGKFTSPKFPLPYKLEGQLEWNAKKVELSGNYTKENGEIAMGVSASLECEGKMKAGKSWKFETPYWRYFDKYGGPMRSFWRISYEYGVEIGIADTARISFDALYRLQQPVVSRYFTVAFSCVPTLTAALVPGKLNVEKVFEKAVSLPHNWRPVPADNHHGRYNPSDWSVESSLRGKVTCEALTVRFIRQVNLRNPNIVDDYNGTFINFVFGKVSGDLALEFKVKKNKQYIGGYTWTPKQKELYSGANLTWRIPSDSNSATITKLPPGGNG